MLAKNQVEILPMFFRDVARLPIIAGKDGYLPLVRRVRRAVTLKQLQGDTFQQTCQNISRALRETQSGIAQICEDARIPKLDFELFEQEVIEFLDDSAQRHLPCLAQMLDRLTPHYKKYTEAETLGWEYIFLLSLFPLSPQRFEIILSEAQLAQKRLIEGTLRYSINVALSFVGRGIPYLDLVQEGYSRAIYCLEGYDERLGHFQQYVATWIRQRIMRYITDTSNLIRVPVHMYEKTARLQKEVGDFEAQHGRLPGETELLGLLYSLNGNETVDDPDDEEDEVDETEALEIGRAARDDWREIVKMRRTLRAYWITTLPPYSLDTAELSWPVSYRADDRQTRQIALSDSLIDDYADPEKAGDRACLRDMIADIFAEVLTEREQMILERRFGLHDGEEQTLEEIGQIVGVTRERIRQIEAQALRKLSHPSVKYQLKGYLYSDHHGHVAYLADRQRSRVLRAMMHYEAIHPIEDSDAVRRETSNITQLIDKYIARGRRGNRKTGRTALLQAMLEELGKPTHYTILHDKIVTQLPKKLRYEPLRTYNALSMSKRFRAYGGGIFGLAGWDNLIQTEQGAVLRYCPTPLLPAHAPQSAFFDLVIYAQQLLKQRPLTTIQFWRAIRLHVGEDAQFSNIQDAFDAWYAVGLFDYVDVKWQRDKLLHDTLPADTTLSEIRTYCLDCLCQRLRNMPELLLCLGRLTRPTLSLLQKTLYGSEKAGFDVPMRLTLLAALGAVWQDDEVWRLTDLGRAALSAHPAQALPVFEQQNDDDIEVEVETARHWDDDDLGLLDW